MMLTCEAKELAESIFEQLRKAVIDGNVEMARELAQKALDANIDPLEIINNGLARGVKEVGDKFGEGEAFLADLIMAGESMKAAMSLLLPKIREMKTERKTLGKVVLGTVSGDIHSIGKDIVASLLEAEGFEVINLGEDVPTEKFLEQTKQNHPDILALSSLLTVTMPIQKEVIEALKREGIREKVKVIIGGAPTSKEWSEQIGADGWAGDASSAVNLAKKLVSAAQA